MSQGGELPTGRVALLFTDVQGSTALLHQLGDAYGEVLDEHDRILRGVWEEFGGVEVDNEGDAFFVVFADHAKAIEAAEAAQHRLAAGAWPDGVGLKVRMGLHSGEPAIRGRKYWGVDVHYAARLGSAAHGGQVLLSADMRAQAPDAAAESVGRHGLKDFPAGRELFHLNVAESRAADFPPPRTMDTVRSNLPTIDAPLFGREAALADLRTHLLERHLVTVVGPGGIGKTRLAVAVGEQLTEEFPDGVAMVTMASLRHAKEVPTAIAEALQEEIVAGDDSVAALITLLMGRRILVILDNAEHLPDLAGPLTRLVATLPEIHWLVTSQAPLNIRAETLLRLPPLEVPTDDEAHLESVAASALFLERARARTPGFAAEREVQVKVAILCQRLEGIPLALELAAARAPVLGLDRLIDAIAVDAGHALGSGPSDLPDRQRGLNAALDWTVSLLSDLERDVYAACAAFAQAWTVDDLEQMLDGRASAADVWDALARLLDLSLMVQRGDGRLSMPERLRRHAAETLRVSGREPEVRSRHALVLAARVRQLMSESRGAFDRAMGELGELIEELQQGLTWTAEHDRETYRYLLAFASYPLYWFGHNGPFVDDAVAFARAGEPVDLAQGHLWLAAAWDVTGVDVPHEERCRYIEACRQCFEVHGEPDDRIWVTSTKILLLMAEDDYDGARAELNAGIERAREAGLQAWVDNLTGENALIDLRAGDVDAAEERLLGILAGPRTSYMGTVAISLLADCALLRGEWRQAIAYFAEDLGELARNDVNNVIYVVCGIAVACLGLKRDEEALELLAAAAGAHAARSGGRPLTDLNLSTYDPLLQAAARRLGEDVLSIADRDAVRVTDEHIRARAFAIAEELRA